MTRSHISCEAKVNKTLRRVEYSLIRRSKKPDFRAAGYLIFIRTSRCIVRRCTRPDPDSAATPWRRGQPEQNCKRTQHGIQDAREESMRILGRCVSIL